VVKKEVCRSKSSGLLSIRLPKRLAAGMPGGNLDVLFWFGI
jgi:hypothetical protein